LNINWQNLEGGIREKEVEHFDLYDNPYHLSILLLDEPLT
jgi:hypothetical protein